MFYHEGQVLKQFDQEASHMIFICSGQVGVYDRKMKMGEKGLKYETEANDAKGYVLLNMYKTGQSLGDPELSMKTPINCRVIAKTDVKVLALSNAAHEFVF